MTNAKATELVIATILAVGSVSLLILGVTNESTMWQTLLVSLGASMLVGGAVWFFQRVLSSDRAGSRRETDDAHQGTPDLSLPAPALEPTLEVFRVAALAPSIGDLVTDAEVEVLAMVISGRNFLNARLLTVISQKIRANNSQVQFKLLALNHFEGARFLDDRIEMMDVRRAKAFRPQYESDFVAVREFASQITVNDPTRAVFDVRFYSMLPTSYFYIIDGTLYLGSLLSKPIQESPLVKIPPKDDECRATIQAFKNHFEYYWSSARYYVTMIALDDDGNTLLVRNRTRRLEWPTGYIEPNEDLARAAMREFTEETGYSVGYPEMLDTNSMGYYFVGRLGKRVSEGSEREVSEIRIVPDLPAASDMSFGTDHRNFQGYLAEAKKLLPRLVQPVD